MDEKKELKKADVVLSDGTAVYFDKHNIKPREWRAMLAPETSEEESNQILARFACLDFEQVHELSMYDMQVLVRAAIDKVREPVPNLPSVSTSQS